MHDHPNVSKYFYFDSNSEIIYKRLELRLSYRLATLVQPDVHVPKIQALPTRAQTALMVGIETVSSQLINLDTTRSPRGDFGRSDEVGEARQNEDAFNRPQSSNSNQYALPSFFFI